MDRRVLLNDAIAPTKTAGVFGTPFAHPRRLPRSSPPLMPALQAAAPNVIAIEPRSMNGWGDRTARAAIKAAGRQQLQSNGFGNSLDRKAGDHGRL
jgi:hypothetical protein